MLDSELMPFIGNFLNESVSKGFPSLASFEVIQEAQPTQQGTPTVPTITFIKVPGDRPRGWPMSKLELVSGKTVQRTTQLYETSINISCLKWQDPALPTAQVVTASDIVNRIMLAFTMPSTIYRFNQLGVSLLRVDEVSNEPFENDQHQFEFHPTCVITITHSRDITDEIGAIVTVEEFVVGV